MCASRAVLLILCAWRVVACKAPVYEGTGEASTTDASTTREPATSESPTGVDPPLTGPAGTSTGADPEASTEASTGAGEAGVSSESTADPMRCGNGVLDPGEGCDLGYGQNSDDQSSCTLACQPAVCGDGLVWVGEEECDSAENNNDSQYNGCTTQCARGPHCGDGALQAGEECDLAGMNGTDESPPNGVPCGEVCRFSARVAFLSSETYRGGDLQGVTGADSKCIKLAQDAGMDNSAAFLAWLSDGAHSPSTRFKHDFTTNNVPYVLPGGTRIADDWDDLLLNGPGDGIVENEKGEISLNVEVWTNTDKNGGIFDMDIDCNGWVDSSLGLKARVGQSGVDKQDQAAWEIWKDEDHWTSLKTVACDGKRYLYCFEQ